VIRNLQSGTFAGPQVTVPFIIYTAIVLTRHSDKCTVCSTCRKWKGDPYTREFTI